MENLGQKASNIKPILKPGIYLYPFTGEEVTLLNVAWAKLGYIELRIVTYRNNKSDIIYSRNIYDFEAIYEYVRPEEASDLIG